MRESVLRVEQVVKEFLQKNWDGTSPLLLAYSGGPDSKALLYAAKECGIPIHVAHVDHGWHRESADEASYIEREVGLLGLPVHITRLKHQTTEEEARHCRLAFFRSLREKIPFQAVLLAHQGNDVAETAFKRLLEGAHLTSLFGMRKSATIEGLTLWRPLLDVRRSEIERYLAQKQLRAFSDPSNVDPIHLRSHIRCTLLPSLAASFGKEIDQNLRMLAERSLELNNYLAIQTRGIPVVKGPFGLWMEGKGRQRIELRYLLQEMGKKEGISFSRQVLEQLLDWMGAGVANRSIFMNQRHMVVDRGFFFLLSQKMPCFGAPVPIAPGCSTQSGDWVIEESQGEVDGVVGWQGVWQGEMRFRCPKRGASLLLPPPQMRGREKWPAFFRKDLPRFDPQGSHRGVGFARSAAKYFIQID